MSDPFQRKWRFLRWNYRLALLGVFVAVSLYFGPNWFNYGRLTRPSPADFVGLVNERCAPVLRAMAAYRKDTGQSAFGYDQLVPKYLPATFEHERGVLQVQRDGDVEFRLFDKRLRIRYSYADGPPHWLIEGRSLSGVVPAPSVPEYRPPDTD